GGSVGGQPQAQHGARRQYRAMTGGPCQGGQMSRSELALAGGPATVAGSNLTWVIVVAVIALCALGVAGLLVREVLAASQGTQKMREISAAGQGGPAAHLRASVRAVRRV